MTSERLTNNYRFTYHSTLIRSHTECGALFLTPRHASIVTGSLPRHCGLDSELLLRSLLSLPHFACAGLPCQERGSPWNGPAIKQRRIISSLHTTPLKYRIILVFASLFCFLQNRLKARILDTSQEAIGVLTSPLHSHIATSQGCIFAI